MEDESMRFLCTKAGKATKGVISIFLSIVLLALFSLGSLVMEAGRYQSAKAQLSEAIESAEMSMLAHYDTTLQKQYGILAMDSSKVDENKFHEYLLFNSDLSEIENYQANGLSRLYGTPTTEFNTMYNLSNPKVLKRQILEYSKYNVPLDVAAEIVDVKNIFKELKKTLTKDLGLDKLLKACDCIDKIWDALKNFGKLQKSVMELQNCGTGYRDWANYFNDFLEGAAEGNVDDMVKALTGQPSDSAYVKEGDGKLCYVSACKKMNEAVQELDYYKSSHPEPVAPQEPEKKTTSDEVNVQLSEMKKQILYELLTKYEKSVLWGGGEGLNESDALLNKYITYMGEIIEYSGCVTVKDKIEKIISENAKILYAANESIVMDKDSLRNKLGDRSGKASAEQTYSFYVTKKSECSTYETWKVDYAQYERDLETYRNEIQAKTDAVKSCATVYIERCDDMMSRFETYENALKKLDFDKAVDAIEEVQRDSHEKKEEGINVFRTLAKELGNIKASKAREGAELLREWKKEALGNADGSDIHKMEHAQNSMEAYFLNKTAAADYAAKVMVLEVADFVTEEMRQILSAIKTLVELIQPFPHQYSLHCVQNISTETMRLLPSQTGPIASEVKEEDIHSLSLILSDAKSVLGSKYQSAIEAVDPIKRTQEAALYHQIEESMNDLGDSLSDIMTQFTTLSSFPLGTLWSILSGGLVKIFQDIKSIINDIKVILPNLNAAIDILLSNLYDNAMLNSYIVDKFPNRVDNSGKSYKGKGLSLIPNSESDSITAFSGGCVEYAIHGGMSEKDNQISVFWTIFALRAINNVICLLTDEPCMELISAANIFAPLVVLVWTYIETNLDMNMMVSGMKVKLIKTAPVLSPEGIKALSGHINNIVEKAEQAGTDEEKWNVVAYQCQLTAKSVTGDKPEEESYQKGFVDFTYEYYCWLFLFFVGNETKVKRVADLIQMDLRYQGKVDFLMSKANTFTRAKVTTTFRPILPIIGMNENLGGLKVKSIKYAGY